MVDIILAPFFTKDIGFSQHDSSHNGSGGSRPDDFSLISSWYDSINKWKLTATIFHNEINESFIQTYKTPNINFVSWETKNRPSYNDERFYAYYDYIKNNKQITRVFCTDIFDVKFYNNPFDLMDRKPSYKLFVGSEITTHSSSAWMKRKCKEMNYPKARKEYSLSMYTYNAGIVGGYRDELLSLFESMFEQFSTVDKKFNANMPVFNYCLDKERSEIIFTGYPLHNIFKSNAVVDGTYIKHK